MENKEYIVTISSKKENKGNIVFEGSIDGDGFNKIEFNPLFVLADLLDVMDVKQIKKWKTEDYSSRGVYHKMNDNYIKHPFFQNENFKNRLET